MVYFLGVLCGKRFNRKERQDLRKGRKVCQSPNTMISERKNKIK